MKSETEFGALARDKYGLQQRCFSCTNNRNRTMYAPRMKPETKERRRIKVQKFRDARKETMDPEELSLYYREKNIWRLYKTTLEEFDALLVAQGGRCAICQTDQPAGKHNQWHVDHSHETDEVRGLLCNNCNRGIGLLRDNINILQAAIEYLSK